MRVLALQLPLVFCEYSLRGYWLSWEEMDHSTVPGSTSGEDSLIPSLQKSGLPCLILTLLLSLLTNKLYTQMILMQNNAPNPATSPLGCWRTSTSPNSCSTITHCHSFMPDTIACSGLHFYQQILRCNLAWRVLREAFSFNCLPQHNIVGKYCRRVWPHTV